MRVTDTVLAYSCVASLKILRVKFEFITLLQNVLDVRHQWSRCQRFEGKIAAFADPTDEQITPVAHQAELVETGHTPTDLHRQREEFRGTPRAFDS